MEGDTSATRGAAQTLRYPRIIQNETSPSISGSPLLTTGAGAANPLSSTAHVFEELLDAEVVVNLNKLREASRQGVDPAYRSIVYRYLLGVAYTDKSREMTMERELEKDFDHIMSTNKRLWLAAEGDDDGRVSGRGEGKEGAKSVPPWGHYVRPRESTSVPFIFLEDSKGANAAKCCTRGTEATYAAWAVTASRLRHSEPYASDAARRERLATTLTALRVYYHNASQYDISHIIAIMLPFDEVHAHARDVFFCTQSLFYLLTHYGNMLQSRRCLQSHCGNFLLLLRATNTPLYQHFFSEGITVLEWVPDMLTTLLAGRLHTEDLLRLWDYYLADARGALSVPLHPYVVLAILAEMTEVLIECEKSEILSRLKTLPRIDSAFILQSAISIRESVYSKGLLPPSTQ